MEVFLGLDPAPALGNEPVLTIGSFDGIHRGHQALVALIQQRAGERGGAGVVLTFEPHPQRVIAPGTAPALLTTREEKLPLLEAAGLDNLVIVPFNRELSQMEAADFVKDVLLGSLGVRLLVLGHDHAFGRGRLGRPELLKEMAPRLGFDLELLDAITVRDEPINSSLIRGYVGQGEVQLAGDLLGRPYSVQGIVVKGDRRGQILGYPTANLSLSSVEKLIPGNGVYAVEVVIRDATRVGACNIGLRPTFPTEEQERSVEVHVLDFSEDIYGECVELRFREKLRDEQAFDAPDALVAQIERDIQETRRILSQEVG